MYRIIGQHDHKGQYPRHWYMGNYARIVYRWIGYFKDYPVAFDVQLSKGEFE